MYEDPQLPAALADLAKPLPDAELVRLPEGLPHDAFGDMVMCSEFLVAYASLLHSHLGDDDEDSAGMGGAHLGGGGGVGGRCAKRRSPWSALPPVYTLAKLRQWLTVEGLMQALVSKEAAWVEFFASLVEPLVRTLLRDEEFQVRSFTSFNYSILLLKAIFSFSIFKI